MLLGTKLPLALLMPCKLWGAETTSLGAQASRASPSLGSDPKMPTQPRSPGSTCRFGIDFIYIYCVLFFFFPPFLSLKIRSQKLHSNPRLPGSDSSAVIALSLRLRLYPCRCEELQLSIQLACLCGGTGFAVEEGSLGARAVTNRSDTARLWHQGRAGRGFSSTVQLPLHSLFGRCAAPRRAAGLPGGSWNEPKHLRGTAGAAASSSRGRSFFKGERGFGRFWDGFLRRGALGGAGVPLPRSSVWCLRRGLAFTPFR